jgi:hypothetical protein
VAQQQKIDAKNGIRVKHTYTATDKAPLNNQNVSKGTIQPKNNKGVGEVILAVTTYDLQTNNTVHDRIVMDDNGDNMSVVWTASETSTWGDRGAGYSHYSPTTGWTISPNYPELEPNLDRSGWPSILYDGNGGEIVIDHCTETEVLKLYARSTIGDNNSTWSEKTISTGYKLWNRAAMGGNDGNTIHLIAAAEDDDSASYENMLNAILYYRSQDAGQTFDKSEVILPGLDSASVGSGRVLSADAYSIVAKGNHVAIGIFAAFNDVILLESMDNGTNWTNTIVHDFPYQGFDDFWAKYDSTGRNNPFIETNDGSGAIIIDDNDVVHMAWGRMQAMNDVTQKGYYIRRSFVDSLGYYRNSPTPYRGFAGNWTDASNDSLFLGTGSSYGWQTYSIVTHPNFAVSGDTIYLSYTGITDTLVSGIDQTTRLHHIFLSRSGDDGNTWSKAMDLTPFDEFSECVFGDLLPTVDDRVRMVYQRDAYPSVYVSYQSNTNPSPNYTHQTVLSDNDIVYLEFTLDGNGIGLIGVEKVLNQVSESTVSPNPSSGQTQLNLVLYQDVDVNINVHNMQGQVVYTHRDQKLVKGKNQVQMDLSHLEPGMYVINIMAGGKNLTERLVIK